jgi:hypothetical protein
VCPTPTGSVFLQWLNRGIRGVDDPSGPSHPYPTPTRRLAGARFCRGALAEMIGSGGRPSPSAVALGSVGANLGPRVPAGPRSAPHPLTPPPNRSTSEQCTAPSSPPLSAVSSAPPLWTVFLAMQGFCTWPSERSPRRLYGLVGALLK